MREKIAEILAENFGVDHTREKEGFIVLLSKEEARLRKADQILSYQREEIEKVENPYPATRKCADENGAIQTYVNVAHTRVEEFRQEILALFK